MRLIIFSLYNGLGFCIHIFNAAPFHQISREPPNSYLAEILLGKAITFTVGSTALPASYYINIEQF